MIETIGNWIWKIENNTIEWTDQTYRIFEVSPETFDLTFENYIGKVHPEDKHLVESYIEKTLTQNEYFKNLEHRILLSNGKTKYVNCEADVKLNDSGQAEAIFGTVQDISERRVVETPSTSIENLISPMENLLLSTLESGTNNSLSGYEKLESNLTKAQHELETFVHMASHVLKAPLSNILGICNIAHTDAFDNINVSAIIKEISNNLNTSLDDLLKVTELNKSKPNSQKFQMKKLIQKVIKETNNHIKPRSFKINIPSTVLVNSNEQMLFIALKKIIENSIKYSELSHGETIVEINYYQTNRNILSIEDNGSGIAHDIIDNIFDMFYRGSASSKGPGLGLYIAKKAVEKIGGKIEIKTVQEEGTKVTLVF